MHVIREMRAHTGLTQSDLAEKSGLSLRTIQRLEKDNRPPKGHSLNVIAHVFEMQPVKLSSKYYSEDLGHEVVNNESHSKLSMINIAAFGFFIMPFGNIFIPLFLWRKHSSSPLVDEVGRKMVNFQILWSICLCLALCIAPFLPINVVFGIPVTLLVLFAGFLVNIVMLLRNARCLRNKDYSFLEVKIRLL